MITTLNATATACPVCGGATTASGRIFHERHTQVAGVPIDLAGLDFHLRRCADCSFSFKDPPIPHERLMACYAAAAEDHWDLDPDPYRRRFDLYRRIVASHAPPANGARPRILDIGCANGAMLVHFGDAWERFGVEPAARAAELATRRGVRILGPTLESVPDGLDFDAVISVDVVEHVADPLPFFQRVARHLRPGGVCITVTGDTDALTWRLEGSHYWYCTITEHISFYNRRSLAALAARTGLEPVEQVRSSHARAGGGLRLRHLATNSAFIVGNRLRGLGIPPLRRRFTEHHAPWWISAHDHLVHVMRRPPRTKEPQPSTPNPAPTALR